jgi:aminoglycoside phosphotransferase (APT) family kinase protein
VTASEHAAADDLEPAIAATLARKARVRDMPPYAPKTPDEIGAALKRLLDVHGETRTVANLRRLAGGASKEQFIFDLVGADGAERLVLRMDPLESAVETSRLREFQMIRAVAGTVPVPPPRFVDADGTHLGAPGVVTGFVGGVAKPSVATGVRISGLGTVFGPVWRARLKDEFVQRLIQIHDIDWRDAGLEAFAAPAGDPWQAARWQVNWWARVWADDVVDAAPIVALADRWLRENLPRCERPVIVHGDYRTGNFLFDEETARITAILDWELCHLGDFHEDLAWVVQGIFGHPDDAGVHLAAGLMPRSEFLEAYERGSGRVVDPETLHFYEVLGVWKTVILSIATSLRAARNAHSHQDVLLSLLAMAGPRFTAELCDLMERGPMR